MVDRGDKEDVLKLTMNILQVGQKDIEEIVNIKKGMTNHSFLIKCKGKKYILRIPGEGTCYLINRAQEANVYKTIAGKGICCDNIYLNVENGCKMSRYMENARVCNPFCEFEVKKCMQKLRAFHEMQLEVNHEFDIFDQINFYESLWSGRKTLFADYEDTKRNVFSLKQFIVQHAGRKFLTHIDAVPDNFLFVTNAAGQEDVQLVDWEYAGMQDQHVDIAMFGIYSMYNQEQMDWLIQSYFYEGCVDINRVKIYCYISICGLLWSNWCEYKRMEFGYELGEYAFSQYRYAKEYFQIAVDSMDRMINGR